MALSNVCHDNPPPHWSSGTARDRKSSRLNGAHTNQPLALIGIQPPFPSVQVSLFIMVSIDQRICMFTNNMVEGASPTVILLLDRRGLVFMMVFVLGWIRYNKQESLLLYYHLAGSRTLR